MSQATNYLEGELVKHLFRTGSFTKPSVLALGLFTSAPGETGGGTEVSGGSYARVQVNPLDANWTAPAGGNGQTANANLLTFPTPTADWGVVTHFGLFDATSGGNLLIYGALNNPKTINNGDPAPEIPAGDISFTVA